MSIRFASDSASVTGGITNSYAKTKIKLIARIEKQPDFIRDPFNYARWLVDIKPTLSPATFRLYKGAILEYLADINASEAYHFLEEINSNGCKSRSKRSDSNAPTSSGKPKFVNYEAYQNVLAFLRQGEGIYDLALAAWLESTIITGLRPHEWRSASLEQKPNDIELIVMNGKRTNGRDDSGKLRNQRSHGRSRTLILSTISEYELAIIQYQLDTIKAHGNEDEAWESFYDNMRNRLQRVVKKIVKTKKRRFSLYSCRHQFAANAKADDRELKEIACLMGHKTTKTCVKHYGRKSYGWKLENGFQVKAKPSELKRIKEAENLSRPTPRPLPTNINIK